jgi:hypothetical protein
VLPLRYPHVWLAIGWLLVIGVIVGSLLPGPVIQEITPPLNDKLEHFTAYFALMVWFAGLYPRAKHLDIAADAVGIAVALALAFWLLEGWCQRLERLTIRSA